LLLDHIYKLGETYPPPWSRALLKKLMVNQPVKEFAVFYGTQSSIAIFIHKTL